MWKKISLLFLLFIILYVIVVFTHEPNAMSNINSAISYVEEKSLDNKRPDFELVSGHSSKETIFTKVYYLEPNLKLTNMNSSTLLVRTMGIDEEASESYYLSNYHYLGFNLIEYLVIETKLTDIQLTEYHLKREENSSYTIKDYRKEIGLE